MAWMAAQQIPNLSHPSHPGGVLPSHNLIHLHIRMVCYIVSYVIKNI